MEDLFVACDDIVLCVLRFCVGSFVVLLCVAWLLVEEYVRVVR